MEIIDFLHLTVRRIVSLVVLGLLVAVPTTAILLRSPASYRGTVTVRLSALLPDGGAFYLWERLTQDFQTALELPQVADEVSEGRPASTPTSSGPDSRPCSRAAATSSP